MRARCGISAQCAGAETIRECNVVTSGYSAEYGKHTGGVLNAITKSGANSLHGSVFEFLRNDKRARKKMFLVRKCGMLLRKDCNYE